MEVDTIGCVFAGAGRRRRATKRIRRIAKIKRNPIAMVNVELDTKYGPTLPSPPAAEVGVAVGRGSEVGTGVLSICVLRNSATVAGTTVGN